jgi:hypothetical protein
MNSPYKRHAELTQSVLYINQCSELQPIFQHFSAHIVQTTFGLGLPCS